MGRGGVRFWGFPVDPNNVFERGLSVDEGDKHVLNKAY